MNQHKYKITLDRDDNEIEKMVEGVIQLGNRTTYSASEAADYIHLLAFSGRKVGGEGR